MLNILSCLEGPGFLCTYCACFCTFLSLSVTNREKDRRPQDNRVSNIVFLQLYTAKELCSAVCDPIIGEILTGVGGVMDRY